MGPLGIVVPPERIAPALAAGADYLEPGIANQLVQRRPGGGWVLADAFRERVYPSFAVLFPGELALSDPREPLDPVWSYLDAILPLVGSVATPDAVVVFGSGTARTIPDGVDRTEAEARFADVVRGTRDRATAQDLRIAVEPLNRGETNLLHGIVETAAFLDAHGIEDVGINADLFHLMAAGEPLDVVREHADLIRHVHLSDSDRRFVGSGDFPWRDFLHELGDAGYEGRLSLECSWGEDAETEMRTSLDLVRAALPVGPRLTDG